MQPESPSPQQVGERLRARRLLAGFTQKQLSERSGISAPYICLIETGKKEAPPRTLRKLARVLGVTLGYLNGDVIIDDHAHDLGRLLDVEWRALPAVQEVKDVDTPNEDAQREAEPSPTRPRIDAQFVLEVRGEALIFQATPTGSYVLWQQAHGDSVRNGNVVVVRIAEGCEFDVAYSPAADPARPDERPLGPTLTVHARPADQSAHANGSLDPSRISWC